MEQTDTLFRCVLERAGENGRERRVVEVWASWPGTAISILERKQCGWMVVSVEPDFSSPPPNGAGPSTVAKGKDLGGLNGGGALEWPTGF